jgi:hypothetical protein
MLSFAVMDCEVSEMRRSVFLEALAWISSSATPAQLQALRRAIVHRLKSLKHTAKGRPRAEESRQWREATAKLVWQREVEGWPWPQVAEAAGLKPTKPNLRTLQNRRDHYALLLWKQLPAAADDAQSLRRLLESKRLQRQLQSCLALPFNQHPAKCRQLVLKLAPIGLRAAANEFSRLSLRRRRPAR